MTNITIGSKIPPFTLMDQEGNVFDVSTVVGTKKLVIYFYPKDDTPGCTAEACGFRDHYEVFTDAGAEVIGISNDSVESHNSFAKKHRLSFRLLSDPSGKIRKRFGVPADLLGILPGRVTYIIDKKGVVTHIFKSQMNAKKHVKEAMKYL